jgi:hypothetical protein
VGNIWAYRIPCTLEILDRNHHAKEAILKTYYNKNRRQKIDIGFAG